MNKVVERNEFYRDHWRAMIVALPILAATILLLSVALVWMAVRPPQSNYFATDNGRIIPLVPVNLPYVQHGFLLSWVAEAVNAAYTLDFQNYRKQSADAMKYFTREGYDAYVEALKSSGHIENVINNRLLSSATTEPSPVLLAEGVVNGVYMWKVRVPLAISYQTQTQRSAQRYTATVVIVRMPTHENPYGIGISQLIVRQN